MGQFELKAVILLPGPDWVWVLLAVFVEEQVREEERSCLHTIMSFSHNNYLILSCYKPEDYVHSSRTHRLHQPSRTQTLLHATSLPQSWRSQRKRNPEINRILPSMSLLTLGIRTNPGRCIRERLGKSETAHQRQSTLLLQPTSTGLPGGRCTVTLRETRCSMFTS